MNHSSASCDVVVFVLTNLLIEVTVDGVVSVVVVTKGGNVTPSPLDVTSGNILGEVSRTILRHFLKTIVTRMKTVSKIEIIDKI